MEIVRGRKRKTSTFNPECDQRLTEEHCSHKAGVWGTIEDIRHMARKTEEGGGRDAAVERFGRRWWDDKMKCWNKEQPAIFGSLYHEADREQEGSL